MKSAVTGLTVVKMVAFESFGTVSYSHSTATMAVFSAVSTASAAKRPPARSQIRSQGRINHGAKRAMAQGPPP